MVRKDFLPHPEWTIEQREAAALEMLKRKIPVKRVVKETGLSETWVSAQAKRILGWQI